MSSRLLGLMRPSLKHKNYPNKNKKCLSISLTNNDVFSQFSTTLFSNFYKFLDTFTKEVQT